ncbi:DUF1877 family protein [Actinomadura parmotrematis]|uniref:YfbM family protein n=1 Tax=Actinomadura parmotrematis TaxID=2864039 RepID=A0ABS7FKD2_9ACTN|nr:DUF1877 family protein [Actinomadura parmotrematis]MBW8480808.1 YfbM family protein [Actinomadura parmotrematis]
MGLAMSYLMAPAGGQDPARIARGLFGTPDWRAGRPVLDLGGAWQALHYLITGDAWDGRQPEADVVCGGRLLTEDGAAELGLDVIYLDAGRVKTAADHLAATPFDAVAGRFDLAAMAGAGVQDADRMDPGVRDRVLRPAYGALGRFYQDAAAEGRTVYKAMIPS